MPEADLRYSVMYPPVFAVDLLTLIAAVSLAVAVDRYWPLWFAGFPLVAVATHLASMVQIAIVPKAYALAQGFWAYPMMAALFIGTWFHAHKSTAKQTT
jgi:hypothetical protein